MEKALSFASSGIDTLIISLPIIPLFALVELHTAILRGANRLSHALSWQNIFFPGIMVVLMPFLWIFYDSVTAFHASLLTSFSLVCTLMTQIFILRNSFSPSIHNLAPAYCSTPWIKTSGMMMLSTAIEQVVQQIDVLIVGTFFGAILGGVYSVAQRFARLISVGLQISNQSTAQYAISSLHARAHPRFAASRVSLPPLPAL